MRCFWYGVIRVIHMRLLQNFLTGNATERKLNKRLLGAMSKDRLPERQTVGLIQCVRMQGLMFLCADENDGLKVRYSVENKRHCVSGKQTGKGYKKRKKATRKHYILYEFIYKALYIVGGECGKQEPGCRQVRGTSKKNNMTGTQRVFL